MRLNGSIRELFRKCPPVAAVRRVGKLDSILAVYPSGVLGSSVRIVGITGQSLPAFLVG